LWDGVLGLYDPIAKVALYDMGKHPFGIVGIGEGGEYGIEFLKVAENVNTLSMEGSAWRQSLEDAIQGDMWVIMLTIGNELLPHDCLESVINVVLYALKTLDDGFSVVTATKYPIE
ncbi:hypothetical protein PQX77_009606, partial [Marasmius sp. AFHP31]